MTYWNYRIRNMLGGVAVLGLTLAGCEQQQAGPAASPPPPEVGVHITETEPVVVTTELPWRTTAYLVAEVRPQVSGIILTRLFDEGGDVQEGDLLYQIDPARYEAVHARAQAALAMAEADLPALRARAERYKNAIGERAVSQQAYDEAVAAFEQAKATVAARKADVRSAEIDLSYTKITAPISGRIGKSNVTVGALVTANQPAALATIHKFDPVYVDVTQASVELLRMRREFESGALSSDSDEHQVKLILEDGRPYPHEGVLQFRDIAVDPTTGSYTLRIVFPNPSRVLLPGMYVRAIVQEGVMSHALLVPQQSVSRTPKGEPVALVVDENNTVQQRLLKLNRAMGNRWLVESGLAPGERLIAEGQMKVRPGATVTVVPWTDTADRTQLADNPQEQ